MQDAWAICVRCILKIHRRSACSRAAHYGTHPTRSPNKQTHEQPQIAVRVTYCAAWYGTLRLVAGGANLHSVHPAARRHMCSMPVAAGRL